MCFLAFSQYFASLFTHKTVSSNLPSRLLPLNTHKDEDSDATQDQNTVDNTAESSEEEDEDESFERSFFPEAETQVHSNKQKAKARDKVSKKHKQHRDARRSSSQSHGHSQRGVLSDTAAQNRQNRRVENSENMSGSAGKRQKTSEKQLQAKISQLQEQLAERERNYKLELAQVRKSVPKGKKRKSSLGGYGHQVPVSSELKERVVVVTGTELWRTCKFLANEDQLFEACEFVMANIPETAALVDEENEDKEVNIMAFNENYGETICRTINVKRGDVQSGLKKAYEARVASGRSVPTPKQLAEVIRRQGLEYDPEDPSKNEENREWFLWYWEHLLSKVGGKNSWGHSIRCYGTISKHSLPDDPKKKYITSSDEALVLVLYENCGQRFPYTAECMTKGRKVDQDHPRYQSRWSDARAGQCKWGGWNLDGRKRYKELRGKISKAKRKEHVEAVESRALAELQAKHNIGNRTSAKKKGAKAKDFEGVEDGLASFGKESDDEETEGEEVEEVSSDFEDLEEVYQAPPPKKSRES